MQLVWQVSKSPSDLEIVLTIIRNHSRAFLEREIISAARKQLDLLEVCQTYFSISIIACVQICGFKFFTQLCDSKFDAANIYFITIFFVKLVFLSFHSFCLI